MIAWWIKANRADMRKLEQQPARLMRAAKTAMHWAVEDAKNHVREVGLGGGSGRLTSRQGIHGLFGSVWTRVSVHGATVLGSLGSGLVYAPVHEYGATIRAKNAPYLRFRIGGHWVRVRQVVIPARPWASPAMEHVASKMADYLGPALKREGLQ